MGFRLRFNGIEANLNPQSVAIKEIALDNAYARVVIETNHTINLLTALRPAETNAPATNRMPSWLPKIPPPPRRIRRPRRCRKFPWITL